MQIEMANSEMLKTRKKITCKQIAQHQSSNPNSTNLKCFCITGKSNPLQKSTKQLQSQVLIQIANTIECN